MINYSNMGKLRMNDHTGSVYAINYLKDTMLNPVKIQYKPQLNITTQNCTQNYQPSGLTPRTSRAAYGKHKQNQYFLPTFNITPDKQTAKKDSSFTNIRQYKDNSIKPDKLNIANQLTTQITVKSNCPQNQIQPKTARDSISKIRAEIAQLRQTVSTPNQFQEIIQKQRSKNSQKIENNTSLNNQKRQFQPEISSQFKKDFAKSKFSSKQHSRNNSKVQQIAPERLITQPSTFTEKEDAYYKTTINTFKGSQSKLTSNQNSASKQKIMSVTDPKGKYFNNSHLRTSIFKVRQKSPELSLNDFQLGACKGEGRFGKVFPAIHKKSGFLVAIKQVKKESVSIMMEQFVQQIKISLFLNHPNIVKMYGCFADNLNLYILMEYMEEGSLYKLVKAAKKLDQAQSRVKLLQICEAVNYLHSYDILHRDIKPENIVLSNGVSKLCDFGWAVYSKERRSTYCGTLDYVCPQILEGQSYDNFVDIWAIGVLAYEMLTGKAPFYHLSRKQTMRSIMNCNFSFPGQMSVMAKLFIQKALKKQTYQRFTIQNLLNDKFLSQVNQSYI